MRRRRPIRLVEPFSALLSLGAPTPFGVPAFPESLWLPFMSSTPVVTPLQMPQSLFDRKFS